MAEDLDARITPTTTEIMAMRSRTIAALTDADMPRAELLNTLAANPSATSLSIENRDALEETLTRDHPQVAAVRARNAAIAAVHQLESERVVQEAPDGVPLIFGTLVTGNQMYNTTSQNQRVAAPIGMRVVEPNQKSALLQLTSRARGWSTTDHEAFAVTSFRGRPSGRLISSDGALVLEEALDNFRLGRFMSSCFMLGAFAETVWMEAASLCGPVDPDVASEIARAQPGADRVMTTTLDFLAPKPGSHARKQLEPWIRATLAVRNIIGHANILQNRTGSFTEASTAVRLVDSYRTLEDLHEALTKKGL